MDPITLFNIAVAIAGFVISLLVRALFARMTAMEQADNRMAEQIAKLREELPERFVRRDDYRESLDAIFNTLRRIEDKVDRKADKP